MRYTNRLSISLLACLSLLLISLPTTAQVNLPPDDIIEPITVDSAERLSLLTAESFPVSSLVMTSNAETIVAGHIDSIYVQQTADGLQTEISLQDLNIEASFGRAQVYLMAIDSQARRLAVMEYHFVPINDFQGRVESVWLWNLETMELIGEIYPETASFMNIAETLLEWNGDTLLVSGCSMDSGVDSCPPEELQLMSFDLDGNLLASDPLPYATMPTTTSEGRFYVASQEFLAENNQLVRLFGHTPEQQSSEYSVRLQVITPDTMDVIHDIEVEQDNNYVSEGLNLAMSPDNTQVAVSDGSGQVIVYDVESGDSLLSFPAHASTISNMTFSPDGTMLATTGGMTYDPQVVDGVNQTNAEVVPEETVLRLWDASSGDLLAEMDLYQDDAMPRDQPIMFTEDSRFIIVGGIQLRIFGVMSDAVCQIDAPSTVNMRESATTRSEVAGQLSAGSSVFAMLQTTGDDGFIWYQLVSGEWVRSDVISAADSCSTLPQAE